MRITIHVKLNKSKEGVEKISASEFVVYTKRPAVEGKANDDIIKQIAKFFKVLKSEVSIVRGTRTKKKVIEIRDEI